MYKKLGLIAALMAIGIMGCGDNALPPSNPPDGGWDLAAKTDLAVVFEVAPCTGKEGFNLSIVLRDGAARADKLVALNMNGSTDDYPLPAGTPDPKFPGDRTVQLYVNNFVPDQDGKGLVFVLLKAGTDTLLQTTLEVKVGCPSYHVLWSKLDCSPNLCGPPCARPCPQGYACMADRDPADVQIRYFCSRTCMGLADCPSMPPLLPARCKQNVAEGGGKLTVCQAASWGWPDTK